MSTISHPPTGAAQEHGWASLLRLRDVWASLAIFAMWIAVAVVSGLSAALGYQLLGDASGHSGAFAQGFAAGALLAMVADTMQLVADDVQTLILPDSGHWVAEQAPQELLAALTTFLASYRVGALS